MPDEVMPEDVRRQVLARVAGWASAIQPPPAEFIKTAEELQPQLDAVRARLELWLAHSSSVKFLDSRPFTDRPHTFRLPVPTDQELSETEAELRTRVLPEVSEQELQQAVEEIPDDPEKLKLVAFLTAVLKYAASIPPTPWLVFVLVFWMAMKMNPDEVGALALAYAVKDSVKPKD